MDDDEDVAKALKSIAYALQCLGNGNAASQMGAIEFHATQVKAGLDAIADAIAALAAAIDRET